MTRPNPLYPPAPTIKEEIPRGKEEEEKKDKKKKKKKKKLLLDRETGVCERACAKLGAAVTPGKVNWMLAVDGATRWQVFSFFILLVLWEGVKKRMGEM